MKRFTVFLFLFAVSLSAMAQDFKEELVIYFRKEKAAFEPAYRDNQKRAEVYFDKVREIQKVSDFVVLRVECIGTASPEGDPRFNEMISELRQKNITRYLRHNLDVPEELIVVSSVSEDWETLAEAVENDPDVRRKEDVLEIIRSGGKDRIDRLLKVDYGRPYWYMYHNIFPDLRAFRVSVVYAMPVLSEEIIVEDLPLEIPETEIVVKETEITAPYMTVRRVDGKRVAVVDTKVQKGDAAVEKTARPSARPDARQFTIKTNAIGWGLAAANAAVEIDFADDWSVNIPVYYSGVNYFKKTLKFRVATVQPEVRYHIPSVDGLFVGAHMGIGWYNLAYGDWRIQDAAGSRPAWGGGLGIGYKLAFRSNPRWKLEFALGAGVYDTVYDKFYNEPNGPYYSQGVRKVFFGIDNASVSVSYSFDLKKKEGRK
ncbi:MAG: DUF3575 domain-containing protein [Bacteroidales bacterium]|nr:DUF3575 domain-containing protein [Bacteroidales bacterium]